MIEPDPPPAVGGAESLLLRRATYEALRQAARRRIQPDPVQFEVFRTDDAIFFRYRGAVAAVQQGAFYTILTDEYGNRFLQGGTINGLDVSYLDLMLFDITLGVDGEWKGNDGDQLYLEVAGNGVVEDDVLLPGFDITSITADIGSPPGHTLPTISSPAGVCIVPLGTFFRNAFYPDMVGSRSVRYCPDAFTIHPPTVD